MRRRALLAVGVPLACGGCLSASPPRRRTEDEGGGKLDVWRVTGAPPGAEVTNVSGSRLARSDVLRTAIRDAIRTGNASEGLSPAEMDRVEDALDGVPIHDSSRYVRVDGVTVRIRVLHYG